MTYEEARNELKARSGAGIMPGLSRMRAAMAALGNPQNAFSAVHIAGTNGKGSVAAMIAAMLSGWGKVGVYTSPAVTGLRDTVTVNGLPVSRERFAACVERVKNTGVPLSEFEFVTSLCFLYFAEEQADIAVIECGMGGAEDATNILPAPLCAVFTPIAPDHTAFLGRTVREIAQHKAGIAKPPCPVVCAPSMDTDALEVIMARAAQGGQTVYLPRMPEAYVDAHSLSTRFSFEGEPVTLSALGVHQAENAVTALQVIRVIGGQAGMAGAVRALSPVTVPCRQEVVSREPFLMLDGAHNPHGIAALCETLRALKWPNATLVLGMLRDKAAGACLAALAPFFGRIVCCTPQNDRALSADELARSASGLFARIETVPDPVRAARYAMGLAAPTVVAGSFYTAAPVRISLLNRS